MIVGGLMSVSSAFYCGTILVGISYEEVA